MHRRTYLSAALSMAFLGGCVGDQYPTGAGGGGGGSGGGGSGSDGGGGDFSDSSQGGEIDTTETPSPLPDPLRDDRLRARLDLDKKTTAIEVAVHEQVNGVRKEHDLPPFPWNEDKNESPRAHSRDMAHHGYFDREGPDGQTFRPGGCNEWAELLFRTQDTNASPDAIARGSVRAWLDSEHHRDNLLNPNFLSHGVGVAISSDGVIYISHSLCR